MKNKPKFYYVYIITNKLSGSRYVGSKICYLEDPYHDNYHGTSKYLDKDIKEYGIESFEKEILEFYKTPEEMRQGEIDKILEYNTLAPNGYNRHLPPDKFHTNGISVYEIWLLKYGKEEADIRFKEWKKKINNSGEKNPMFGKHHSLKAKEKISKIHKGKYIPKWVKKKISESTKGEKNPFYGKIHTEETKERIRQKQTGKRYSSEVNKKKGRSLAGRENGMFGKIWITNNIENKIISKEELNNYLENGWTKGRKMYKL